VVVRQQQPQQRQQRQRDREVDGRDQREQHGKLVVVCSDTAQITKISNTTKENTFATKENTFAFSSLRMVMTAANTPRPSLS